jgi:hypothetical protein
LAHERRNYRAVAKRAIAVCPALDRPGPYDIERIQPDSAKGGFWLHQDRGVKFQPYNELLATVAKAERTGYQCVLTIFAGLKVEEG